MIRALLQLKEELGLLGLCSLAVLVASGIFFGVVVKPLEERALGLERDLQVAARRSSADGFKLVGANSQSSKLAAFYRFFDRQERTEDWLAKLYGIATASGLELRQGDYRLAESRQRLERYQIRLPVIGGYSQIRAFLEIALAEIPVLSLDQAVFRRKSPNESRIEAEIVLTLHLLRK